MARCLGEPSDEPPDFEHARQLGGRMARWAERPHRSASTFAVRRDGDILRGTNSPSSVVSAPRPADLAASVVDVVPLVMRAIRSEMRAAASPALSVPQLRTLLFVKRNPDVNLSALAEHLGIGLTGASGLVDRLVRNELLSRETDPNERRRIQLTLTPHGRARLDAASNSTRSMIEQRLTDLDADDAATVEQAMTILRGAFGGSK